MLNGKPYCRRCISFKGEEVKHEPSYPKKAPIHLEYELSSEQKELSDKLVENYKKGIDSLVFAVCGSGKTEIVLSLIQYAIECGEKVAFAVPRKDVVIELYNRLKQIFSKNRVIALYGGHHQDTKGDLVVLTTHQLYRYKKYFSLIVLDEIDAFPFKGDETLYRFFMNSLSGHYVMMSATPSEEIVKHFSKEGKDMLTLSKRFHHQPLPVPEIVIRWHFTIYFALFVYLRKFFLKGKPVFIFAPTISDCESLYKLLSLFFKRGNYVHSKRERRSSIIEGFRKGIYRYLVTTSVLERGVTMKNLQVIIFHTESDIYDEGTIIQIAGRVGRKKDAPDGEVILLANKKTVAMEKAIAKIKEANLSLLEEEKNDKTNM